MFKKCCVDQGWLKAQPQIWDISEGVRSRNSRLRLSLIKSVLRNSAKFTGKHLSQRLFFNKVVGLGRQLY